MEDWRSLVIHDSYSAETLWNHGRSEMKRASDVLRNFQRQRNFNRRKSMNDVITSRTSEIWQKWLKYSLLNLRGGKPRYYLRPAYYWVFYLACFYSVNQATTLSKNSFRNPTFMFPPFWAVSGSNFTGLFNFEIDNVFIQRFIAYFSLHSSLVPESFPISHSIIRAESAEIH